MSCLDPSYNPVPPRAWSRWNLRCPSFPVNGDVQVPYSNKKVPVAQYPSYITMLNKGNVLQYKKNSSNLTQKQRYAQIAKGQWTNRTTTWATQTQKYSNPNTQDLLRVQYQKVFLDTGLPTDLPVTCPTLPLPLDEVVIPNGGNLVCNTRQNFCDGSIIYFPPASECNPTSNSDVPGPIMNLCWNDGTQTWYPRTRLTTSSSGGNKFPQGYKRFVSANGIPAV
jgi:hypothetical protein